MNSMTAMLNAMYVLYVYFFHLRNCHDSNFSCVLSEYHVFRTSIHSGRVAAVQRK